MIANVQNAGDFVPGVPRDFEVEIPCLVSGRGIQGIRARGLPKAITMHILRDRVAPVEMELQAYLSGSRGRLIDLILMHKWVLSRQQTEAFLDDIQSMRYHEKMRRHNR